MNKLKFIFTGVITSVILLTSCSSNDETPVVQQQNNNAVAKTAKMLSFEESLKDFYKSKSDNNIDFFNKNNSEANLEVQNRAINLLKELGVNQTNIDTKKAMSDETLIYFALEEYSKKLSQMYNENKK